MILSKNIRRFTIVLCVLVLALLMIPSNAFLKSKAIPQFTPSDQQSGSFRIKEQNPVVNEGNPLTLTAVDAAGQPVSGVTFESGSPDVVSIDSPAGTIRGVQRGYATVTARKGSESFSFFVTVARVSTSGGAKVPGDQKADTSGAVYFSDPINHVILKKDNPTSDARLFAGQMGSRGNTNGLRDKSLFAGPTAVAIDNRPQGGVYVADTLNHSIRKISFNDQTTSVVGNGSPGVNTSDVTPFKQAAFNGPEGVGVDVGGNVFVADTNNNAIYMLDFQKEEVRLIAGEPGMNGNSDGQGRAARFNRPKAITVRSKGASFFSKGDPEGTFVADTGNNRIRFITRDGKVSTLGPIPSNPNIEEQFIEDQNQAVFDFPGIQSLSVDNLGNIYVVDNSGAKVISQVSGSRQVTSLAQPGVGFKATNVLARGNETFVLDANASGNNDAVKVVTVGAPEIISLSKNEDRLEGGTENIIRGKNFAPDSVVIIGDSVVPDVRIVSATEIRLTVPQQNAPGKRTLSILTRGGVVQREFRVISKPFSEIGTGEITTLAGGIPFLGDGGKATLATFSGPQGISVDGDGNLFILDTANNRIRRIDTAGIITTVAGNGTAGFSGDNGPAIGASLNTPRGLALDGSGRLFITDSNNFRVRSVDLNTGIITTVAGNGNPGFTGDGGPATNATLGQPYGVAVDVAGNIFITDPENSNIRRVDAKTGMISTMAGSGDPFGKLGDGGPAINASLNIPTGITVDIAGNTFIFESGRNIIRKVDTKGIISTVAGNGTAGFSGDNGPAKNASLNLFISGTISVNQFGELFIVDVGNDRIRKVDTRGIITTIAGNGSSSFSGDGGPALNASLSFGLFAGMAIDGAGNLIIADENNVRIRLVNTTGIINTIAGTDIFTEEGSPAVGARLSNPFKVILDKNGNLLSTDSGGLIRKIDINTGLITTVAGGGGALFAGDGGPALRASLRIPTDVVMDNAGNLFIADPGNYRVRRVDAATGIITTYAGNGCDPLVDNCFFTDGVQATNSSIGFAQGLAIDKAGNLYIADGLFGIILRVDPNTRIIKRIAGKGTDLGFSGDGGPAINALFRSPEGMVVDANNNLFIADTNNSRIRKIDLSTGIITTVAGNGNFGFSGDGGSAISASLNRPIGVSFDNAGNLLIADTNNHVVRRVDSQGIIRTIAGNAIAGYSGDGKTATNASINKPFGVVVNSTGDLFIAAGFNDAIRVVRGQAAQPQPGFTLNVSPVSQTVVAGSTTKFTIEIDGQNGFTQAVNLSTLFTTPEANGKIITTLSTATAVPGSKVDLTVSVSPDTEPFTFGINVIGTAGQLVRQQTINLIVTSKPSLMITAASFTKPNLNISGIGFGTTGARVSVNGVDVSGTITSQTDSSITLKGNKKKLNLRKGSNQVTVTAGGVTSNTFVFNFFSNLD